MRVSNRARIISEPIGPFPAFESLTLPSTGMRFLPKNPMMYAEYTATAAAARRERCVSVSAIGR